MIYDCTYLMKKCYDSQNYKLLGQYKEVENFLNMTKDSMDMKSYLLVRKKLSFDKNWDFFIKNDMIILIKFIKMILIEFEG